MRRRHGCEAPFGANQVCSFHARGFSAAGLPKCTPASHLDACRLERYSSSVLSQLGATRFS